jgi:hypothetical protein
MLESAEDLHYAPGPTHGAESQFEEGALELLEIADSIRPATVGPLRAIMERGTVDSPTPHLPALFRVNNFPIVPGRGIMRDFNEALEGARALASAQLRNYPLLRSVEIRALYTAGGARQWCTYEVIELPSNAEYRP